MTKTKKTRNAVPPVRRYADPIDEDALHDQLEVAMGSEEQAFDALPAKFDPSQGQGMPYDLVDPMPARKLRK